MTVNNPGQARRLAAGGLIGFTASSRRIICTTGRGLSHRAGLYIPVQARQMTRSAAARVNAITEFASEAGV
jgi:hypothetical protein